MFELNYSTESVEQQLTQAMIEAARAQHFSDLAKAALYQYYVLSNGMQPPPALPAGCLADPYVAECLLSHLREEFKDIRWPVSWSQLEEKDISSEVLAKVHLVARRRTFLGTCDICKELQSSKVSPPIPTVEAVDAYLESKKSKGLSRHSLKLYTSVLTRFAKAYAKLPVRPEPIEEFLAQFSPNKSTRRTCYRIVKRFYKFLAKRYGIQDPMHLIDTPSAPHKVIESLDPEELGRLIDIELSPRDRAAILVMAGCGIRQGEARSLTFGDIGTNSVKVNGKTGERRVPASCHIVDALLALRNDYRDTDPVFWGTHPTQPLGSAGFELLTKKAFARAGITGKRASPHTLRYTFARICIVNGMDTATLKVLMGHASIATTEKYLCFAQREIENKYNQYAPLSHLTSDHRLTLPHDRLLSHDDQLPL